MSIDRALLQSGAAAVGAALNDKQLDVLEAYYDAVIEANRDFNLTAITSKEDFVIKHFIDSLSAVPFIPYGASLCDIGTGAGFPAVPLAVARPDIQVTAVDSTAKKIVFVTGTAKDLGIKNLRCIAARAEERTELRGNFDTVAARAVSSLPVLAELCVPLLKTGGVMIAYKTDGSEVDSARAAFSALGARFEECKSFALPNGDARALLIARKIKETPKQYPRLFSAIKKKPL